MKLRDLTEDQAEKICDYLDEKYLIRDEKGFPTNWGEDCRHCPFGVTVDDSKWRECCMYHLFKDLPEELEEVIKND